MPSARLTLVCQASNRATRSARFGSGDDPPDEIGRRHAVALAVQLGPVDRSWSSPARCALATAAALRLDAEPTPALRDCDFGRWTGRTMQHVLLHEPRALLRWMRDPDTAPHGGETVAALIGRAGGWIDGQLRRPGHGVAVTHAAVIRAVVAQVLGGDQAAFWRVDVLPLSRVELRSNGRRWALRAIIPPGSPPAGDEVEG